MELIISPRKDKKYRILFLSGEKVDFGAKGYSDFTIHKDPNRMRNYVRRHGGIINERISSENDVKKIELLMLNVIKSTKEDWTLDGIYTAGFWSRWLLWSAPSIEKAKRNISYIFKLKFKKTSTSKTL
jgi:hypothetical protein